MFTAELFTSCVRELLGESTGLPDKLLEVKDGALDAGLRIGVVVLDAVQQLAQAPVAVRLHLCFR